MKRREINTLSFKYLKTENRYNFWNKTCITLEDFLSTVTWIIPSLSQYVMVKYHQRRSNSKFFVYFILVFMFLFTSETITCSDFSMRTRMNRWLEVCGLHVLTLIMKCLTGVNGHLLQHFSRSSSLATQFK